MLPNPLDQVRGHSDVQGGMIFIGEDIDVRSAHRVSYKIGPSALNRHGVKLRQIASLRLPAVRQARNDVFPTTFLLL